LIKKRRNLVKNLLDPKGLQLPILSRKCDFTDMVLRNFTQENNNANKKSEVLPAAIPSAFFLFLIRIIP
jgi:hypothetical protein